MKLIVLLDAVSIEALIGASLLYVVLPLGALVLLVWFFIKRKNRKQ